MLAQYLDRAARLATLSSRLASIGLPRRWALDPTRRHQFHVSNLDALPLDVRRNPGVCIDAGANVGAWSLAALEMLRAPRVLAFEPQAETFRSLATALSRFPGSVAHQVGLGASEGTLRLRVQPDSVFTSFLEPRPDMRGGEERFEEVRVMPLDAYTGELDEVGLLKLDVQGFERQVIEGARATLAKTRCVCVEVNYVSHYDGDDDFDALHRMFTDRGFRIHGISAPAKSPVDGRPLWADAVYVKR